jgi:uncharacterized protein YggU (UPF0235/DUF167 family)
MLDVREKDGAVLVSLRVRPRSRPGFSMTEAGLVVAVASPPEKGRATEEARGALAEALGVPPSAIELRSGATARRKVFAVTGVGAVQARRLLLGIASS